MILCKQSRCSTASPIFFCNKIVQFFFKMTIIVYSAIQCEILEKERDEANEKLSRMEEGESLYALQCPHVSTHLLRETHLLYMAKPWHNITWHNATKNLKCNWKRANLLYCTFSLFSAAQGAGCFRDAVSDRALLQGDRRGLSAEGIETLPFSWKSNSLYLFCWVFSHPPYQLQALLCSPNWVIYPTLLKK